MINKKNIWYISKYIAPASAARVGARGFLLLKEFARRGHSATLITSDSNHLVIAPVLTTPVFQCEEDGVNVLWLRTKKYVGVRSLGRVLSWLDFERRLWKMPKKRLDAPDVIIVSSLSLLTIVNGFLLKRKYKCKLIFEIRDIWPMVLTETGRLSPFNPFVIFLQWIERFGYKKSDLIVGTMPNLGEHVESVLGFKRPVVCVPQGVDAALLSPPDSLSPEFVDQYIKKDKLVICHAGSIGADNALETLVACAHQMQDRPDIHFLIVGEGDLKVHFQEQTKGLGNITFAPRVEKSQVQSVLSYADIVYFAVHASPIWRFGQSLNKVVDYMLSGKPIIASYTGYPSMLNEAECGSYVPAGDVAALRTEIERFATLSEEERSAIGGRGRAWLLENRTYEKLADDYLEHLSRL